MSWAPGGAVARAFAHWPAPFGAVGIVQEEGGQRPTGVFAKQKHFLLRDLSGSEILFFISDAPDMNKREKDS
jgi:hypothetical protein